MALLELNREYAIFTTSEDNNIFTHLNFKLYKYLITLFLPLHYNKFISKHNEKIQIFNYLINLTLYRLIL